MVRKSKKHVRDVAVMVKEILEQHPKTRDDDYLLYAFVLNKYGMSKDIGFWNIAVAVKEAKIPSQESVGRARRKAQELYPQLKATPDVEEARINKTGEYIEFAQDGSI